jgi:hypothetical protein
MSHIRWILGAHPAKSIVHFRDGRDSLRRSEGIREFEDSLGWTKTDGTSRFRVQRFNVLGSVLRSEFEVLEARCSRTQNPEP